MSERASLESVLSLVKEKNGIVAYDWGVNPRKQGLCCVVFPRHAGKNIQARSEFVRHVINLFYPACVEEYTFNNSVRVLVEGNRDVMLLESNMDAAKGKFNDGREYLSYNGIKGLAERKKFLGVEGVLVQTLKRKEKVS